MSEKPVVVVSHRVHPEVTALLSQHAVVVGNGTDDSWPIDLVRRRCRDASALIAFMPDRVDDAFLAACPRLRIIACALKGFDNFDVAACTRHGVWITAVPDLLTAPTAELAVGLTIGLARHIAAGDRWVRGGGFRGWRPVFYGTGLAGSTVGIVGFGAVGRAIARRLAGFEARLLFFDAVPVDAKDAQAANLDALLATADIVIVAAPLTPDTRGMIGERALAGMKPGALLVNVGRGSVVDEDAVARALAAGRLGFGGGDGIAERHPGVAGELRAANAEDHVADLDEAGGGRSLVHLGHEDLAGLGGDHRPPPHRSAQSGRSEVPVLLDLE